MAKVDVVKEQRRLVQAMQDAQDAYRESISPDAPEGDEYLKLQYQAAQQGLQRFTSYWRQIDASVAMGVDTYGRPTGEGRRGGEFIRVDETGT